MTSQPLPPPPALPEYARGWSFFLDIDGTLLDHAPTPGSVAADTRTRGLVEKLGKLTGGAVALISGRGGKDIQRLFDPLKIALAGQHGVERRDLNGRLHMHDVPAEGLRDAARRLLEMEQRHPGLVFEDKGLNLAMHYRLAPALGTEVERVMRGMAHELGPQFEMQGGKMLWEIKPSGRDKGTAIAEFVAEAPFAGLMPVFIGDDVTDETAFAMVNALGGVTIKVGPGETSARHRLADAESVRRWLEGWIAWREGQAALG